MPILSEAVVQMPISEPPLLDFWGNGHDLKDGENMWKPPVLLRDFATIHCMEWGVDFGRMTFCCLVFMIFWRFLGSEEDLRSFFGGYGTYTIPKIMNNIGMDQNLSWWRLIDKLFCCERMQGLWPAPTNGDPASWGWKQTAFISKISHSQGPCEFWVAESMDGSKNPEIQWLRS